MSPDGGIRPTKVLNVQPNSQSRWGGVHDTVTRNNVLADFITQALGQAPTAAAPATENDSQAAIDLALDLAFGELRVDANGARIPRSAAPSFGDVDNDDNDDDGASSGAAAAAAALAAGAAAAAASAGSLPENDDDVH